MLRGDPAANSLYAFSTLFPSKRETKSISQGLQDTDTAQRQCVTFVVADGEPELLQLPHIGLERAYLAPETRRQYRGRDLRLVGDEGVVVELPVGGGTVVGVVSGEERAGDPGDVGLRAGGFSGRGWSSGLATV